MDKRIGIYEPYKMPLLAINGQPYNKGEYRSLRGITKNHFVVIPAFLPKGYDIEKELEAIRKGLDVDTKSNKDTSK